MLFRSIQFSLYKSSTNGHVCIFLELEEIYSITHGEFAVGAIGVTKNHVVLETKRNTHPLWWMSGETLWILNPNKTITCCYTDFLSHSMDDAIISVLTVQCSWSVKMSNAAFWRPFHTHTHTQWDIYLNNIYSKETNKSWPNFKMGNLQEYLS